MVGVAYFFCAAHSVAALALNFLKLSIILRRKMMDGFQGKWDWGW